MTDPKFSDRRSDIDWLRVLAFSLLILYHAGLPYAAWDWVIIDNARWPALQEVMLFITRWRMPLIFLIAGATIMLSLGRRSGPAFVVDRLKRLLIPLVFGVLVIVPPQIYFQRLQEHDFVGSYLEFYPHFFDGFYPDGNFTWQHLWFLGYMLVLALVLLPLLLWIRSVRGAALVDRCSALVARYNLFMVLAALLFAANYWLVPVSSNRGKLIGDWYELAYYGVLILAGALLYRSPALLQSLQRQRFVAVAIGVIAYALFRIGFYSQQPWTLSAETRWLVLCALSAIITVAWLIAAVGFARQWARPTRFLRYATSAVYPFYILHQTVVVIAAFYLTQTDWNVVVKYFLTALITFSGCWLLYEGVIKRFAVLRLLFGMSPRVAPPAPVVAPPLRVLLREEV